MLLLTLLAVGGLWAFAGVAEEVLEGDTRAFDTALLLALRSPGDLSDPLGPRWLEEFGRDVTGLGSVGILTFVAGASIVYLLLLGKPRTALFVFVAIGGGVALSFALKAGFARPRPDLVPHGAYVYTTSFPSGHAMKSALVYLTLGALLARFEPRRRVEAYFLVLAIVTTLSVGVSRVYLGVHWPTDVLAGWTAGASWATVCWIAAIWLQQRRTLERPAGAAGEA